MKTRVLSGIIMLPLLVVIALGGKVLLVACFLLTLLALWEFYRGFENIKHKPVAGIGYAATLVLYVATFLFFQPEIARWMVGRFETFYLLWFFLCTFACLLCMFRFNTRTMVDGMATLTGIAYIVFFAYHVVLVESEFGLAVWFVVLAAFGTDIFAYFTGVLWGKHKLCPNISPKKTVEGAFGGLIGSVLLCFLFNLIFLKGNPVVALSLGFLCGITSQFGDLTASLFKRQMGIKDYGKIIPGHGGVLDRIDSLLFTAPTVYYSLMVGGLITSSI